MPTRKKPAPVTVVPDDTAPEVLAKSVVDISRSASKLLSSPLKIDAIVVLIQESLPVKDRPTRRQIYDVLDAATKLGKRWTR